MASASEDNSTGKRQKCCGDSGIDRLSDLPEAIVSHIFSFLPTESAVTTSFLSKSWKLRWTKLLNTLAFDYGSWISRSGDGGGSVPKMSFDQFVNMVLFKHSAESIHKFSLKWYGSDIQSIYLSIWVDTIIARNVQVIDLDVTSGNDTAGHELNLSAAFYSCGTLEVLKLSGNLVVKLPYVVRFPKLTVLELDSVRHESDESFHKLISGCPRLQSLSVHRSYDDSVRVFTISSPTLKRLEMTIFYPDDDDDELETLKVRIETPELESLVLFNIAVIEYSILGPTLVNEAELDIKDGVFGLVQNCDHLKFLNLSLRSMDCVHKSSPTQFSASFERLTKLAVEIDASNWSCLLNLINCCINLEILDITRVPSDEECWKDPVSVPRCISSSLRRMSFKGFFALDDELGLLKFILQHGILIETVTLFSQTSNPFWSCSTSCDQKLRILNKVLQLPRSSPSCKISYSWGIDIGCRTIE